MAGSAKIKAWGTALTIEQEFDWATLTSITGMRYVRVQSRLDPDFTPIDAQFADVQGATRSYQQELRLASTGGGPLNWQFGGFYYNSTAKLLGQTVKGLALGGPDRGLRIISTGKTKSYAAFGEITYDITPTTHITGGVRYTREKRAYRGQQVPVNQVAGSPLVCAFTQPQLTPAPSCLLGQTVQAKTFEKVTYRGAIRQDITDEINVYASYNRGFKSGIYALNATPTPAGAPILKPQVIDAIEGGFKSELFDRMVRLNAAYFHYKIKDYQIRTAAPGSIATAILLNAGRVKVDGAEVEMVIAPTRELRITANATYLNSRFGSFLNNASFVPRTTGNVATPCVLSSAPRTGGNASCFNQNATGNKTPLSPKFAISLGVNYTMPVGDDGELIFNALVNRTGRVFFEADNRLSQPAFTIVNGAIEYKPSPNWGIEFFVNNLTDKQYYVVAVGGSTGDHGELAAPRTYGVNLKFDF